jgi:hypothetical protein
MIKQIFVNLPVKDLQRSIEFFTHLGFNFDPQFSNDTATCMIVSENIFVMLLIEPFFKTFTDKSLCDAHKKTEVLVCLAVDHRQAVDDMVSKALSAGGSSPRPPQDHGFMYSHGFEDLDGHIWEVIYMSGKPSDQPANVH